MGSPKSNKKRARERKPLVHIDAYLHITTSNNASHKMPSRGTLKNSDLCVLFFRWKRSVRKRRVA